MLKILKQPYPSTEVTNKNFYSSLITGLFIFLFLLFFQPFGINNWNHPNKQYYLIIFGVLTAAMMIFNFFLIKKRFFKWFEEVSWTVGKHILWSLYMIVSISIVNYIFSVKIGLLPNNFISAGHMFIITFLVGVFPTSFFTFTDYFYQLKKYNTENLTIEKFQDLKEEPKDQVILKGENNKDSIFIHINSLLFIESSDNYVTIVSLENGILNKSLLRSSLSRMENQISSRDIVRCHRSYIINLKAVIKITGNAQGYKLYFQNFENPVPVARKFAGMISDYFKK